MTADVQVLLTADVHAPLTAGAGAAACDGPAADGKVLDAVAGAAAVAAVHCSTCAIAFGRDLAEAHVGADLAIHRGACAAAAGRGL
eukprot:scaffold312044_cov19-Tisochrysis_lutea.AAC.1